MPTHTGARPRGRPGRIDRAEIGKAVNEIGVGRATMRLVADHLEVTVPALYRHVSGKDDLTFAAAEHVLAGLEVPRYSGQDWASWLREWAALIRVAMGTFPALIELHINGGMGIGTVMSAAAPALDRLVDQGFDPLDALDAWDSVLAVAIGSAVDDVRERTAAEKGQPWISAVHSHLAMQPADDLPTVRAILGSGYVPDPDQSFERRVTDVLVGIAFRTGRDPGDVQPGQRLRQRSQRAGGSRTTTDGRGQ